jgi:hypothetical protein
MDGYGYVGPLPPPPLAYFAMPSEQRKVYLLPAEFSVVDFSIEIHIKWFQQVLCCVAHEWRFTVQESIDHT